MNQSSEQHKVNDSRQEITEIKSDVAEIKEQTQEMFNALMGNKLTQDGGLVLRLIKLETQTAKMDLKIDAVAKQEDRKMMYLGALWVSIGAVVGMIISYIIQK